jgi:hypothetical protein
VASVVTLVVASGFEAATLNEREAPSTPVTVKGNEMIPPASTEKLSDAKITFRDPRFGLSSEPSELHDTHVVVPTSNKAASKYLPNLFINLISILFSVFDVD